VEFCEIDSSLAEPCAAFLRMHERSCASLVDSFRSRRRDVLQAAFVQNGSVRGVVSCSKGGVVLFCLPFTSEYPSYTPFLRRLFAHRELFCVNGEETGAVYFMRFFASERQLSPEQINRYYLMERDKRLGPLAVPALPPMYTALRCADDDLPELLVLEEGFEKEDVLQSDQGYDAAVARAKLVQQLRKKVLFAIRGRQDGFFRFVAKSAVNAQGYAVGQLGGVYTLPEYRRHGFGYAAVCTAVNNLTAAGLSCVLFVRETNTAAYSLYYKAGFVPVGRYIISYY